VRKGYASLPLRLSEHVRLHDRVNEFRAAFREVVRNATRGLATSAVLESTEERDLLIVPQQREKGFEFRLECFDYGVYPTAAGWRGGCWDVTVYTADNLREALDAFLKSLLNDAVLEVRLSNARPYKWILHYCFDGARVADETGRVLFNWFGRRSTERFSNGPAT